MSTVAPEPAPQHSEPIMSDNLGPVATESTPASESSPRPKSTSKNESVDRPTGFQADSLAMGMVVMLAMTILQRGLGFGRGIWFCRLMSDTDVGAMSMAYDFIIMMTPIAMMGIPGSLARYVEHFRQRGQLTPMIWRMGGITAVLGGFLVVGLMQAREFFSWLIFLESGGGDLIVAVAVGVAAIVTFNFVYELLASLRQVRMASMMQFIQSVTFSIVGVAWLYIGGSLAGLIGTFAAATILAIVPGLIYLRTRWQSSDPAGESFNAPAMWRRLLPYAAALWVMNIITNLFGMSDRYMILHWMPGGDDVTRAAVGQYHSARIVPLLLTSLAAMVAGVLLPYLSADWEKGLKNQVVERLKQTLAAMSVLFTLGGAATLVLSPWLFGQLLQGRYAAGLSLMPMAMVYCTWTALATIAQSYLWVTEKGKWVGVAVAIGLVLNVIGNWLLLPVYGLYGAVLATCLANAAVLVVLWWTMHRVGYEIDRDTVTMSLLPATLLIGGYAAVICSILVIATTPMIQTAMREAKRMLWAKIRPAQADPSSS